MTYSTPNLLRLALLVFGLGLITACGQKGPIEIEREPPLQEDVLDETI